MLAPWHGLWGTKASWGNSLTSWVTYDSNKVAQGHNSLCKETTWWAMGVRTRQVQHQERLRWAHCCDDLDAIDEGAMPWHVATPRRGLGQSIESQHQQGECRSMLPQHGCNLDVKAKRELNMCMSHIYRCLQQQHSKSDSKWDCKSSMSRSLDVNCNCSMSRTRT